MAPMNWKYLLYTCQNWSMFIGIPKYYYSSIIKKRSVLKLRGRDFDRTSSFSESITKHHFSCKWRFKQKLCTNIISSLEWDHLNWWSFNFPLHIRFDIIIYSIFEPKFLVYSIFKHRTVDGTLLMNYLPSVTMVKSLSW